MSDIVWPQDYLPGFTDNFASNEIVVPKLNTADVWPYLVDPRFWPTYYSNVSEISFHEGFGPELSAGARFRFTTFGFQVEAEIVEYVPPAAGQPARLAWHGWSGEAQTRGDAHHAWLIEDLPGGRVRLLTQETQKGQPARDLAATQPNPMINAHQEWLEGLARSALHGRTCAN
ncbi:MAG TPA: SRPBCC domain-containing protein [Phenylobacterium sp.]|nr:SRPBCC domain-containing protein [Phenylobacterium sp.]